MGKGYPSHESVGDFFVPIFTPQRLRSKAKVLSPNITFPVGSFEVGKFFQVAFAIRIIVY